MLLRAVGRVQIILAVLALTVLMTEPVARRYGDRLQIALPTLAWGCAIANRAGTEFAVRFAAMFVAAHGAKRALGDTPLNIRPTGREHGFPSAHTSAAVLGASSLIHDCIPGKTGAAAVVVMAAGFVGASRIEARAHDIWQVLAGAILGYAADRALRRDSAARRRLIAGGRKLKTAISGGLSKMFRAIASVSKNVGGRLSRWTQAIILAQTAALSLVAAEQARAEVEFSLYGGWQEAADSTVRATGMPDARVSWKGKSFAMPPYYGLRATWWQSDVLGYGVDFNHAKVYADNPSDYGYDHLEMTDGINILTLNLWRRWPDAGWAGGRLVPYAGAGIGVAIPHVEVTPAGGEATFGYQLTGPAVQAVAGASWLIDDNWSLFGEVKATWSKHKADLDSGGTMRTDITTGAVNFGVSYRF